MRRPTTILRDVLERAYEEHAAGMDTIAITPALAPLHADPRWAHLLRRMGLAT